MLKYVLPLFAVLLIALSCQPSVSAHHSSDWLYRIMMCESGGDPLAVNEQPTERHANGQIGSYGLFQFGIPTWQIAVKAAQKIGYRNREWIHWIHAYPDAAPEDVQWDMARLIWNQEDGKGWRHWRNCAIQIGFPAAVSE